MLYYNQSVIGCYFSHPRIFAFLNTWCVCVITKTVSIC